MSSLGRYSVQAFLFLACMAQAVGQAAEPPPRGLAPTAEWLARQKLPSLNRKIADDPSNASLLLERARLHRDLGDFDRMRADADKAVANHPQSAETWIAAGRAIGDVAPYAALQYYNRAVHLEPQNVEARRMRAVALSQEHRHEAALADVDAALKASPKDALLIGMKANILMHFGNFKKAIDVFSQSIQIEPLAQTLFDRGYCYSQIGDLPRAIEDYSAAHRLDPSLLGAIAERGRAYQLSGDFRRAVADLERARKTTPDDASTKLLLSWLYATAPDEVVRDGRKALMLAGSLCDPVTCRTAEYLTALAASYAELGNFDKAIALQERAVAVSHFDREFNAASAERLTVLRNRRPIREARTPPVALRRAIGQLPRTITIAEALAAPPDVLGIAYLEVQTLLLSCSIAKGGGVVHALLFDEIPISITSENADQVKQRLEERKRIFMEAIRKRGFVQLAPGYRPQAAGACDEWGLSEAPWLVEQDGFDAHFTQGSVRHMGVVIESAVVLRHDLNTGILIAGQIVNDQIVLVTPQRYGIIGTAHERCTLTLTPAKVEGEEWAAALIGRAGALRSYEEYAPALADVDRAVEMAPSPQLLAYRAFALAAWPDSRFRNGRLAVESAARAIELSRGEPDMNVLAAAAVAAAEAGDFPGAIAYQKRALKLAPEDVKAAFEPRLRLFESRRPYHEEGFKLAP